MRIWLNPDKLAKNTASTSRKWRRPSRSRTPSSRPGASSAPCPLSRGTQLNWRIDTLGRLQTPEQFGEIIVRTGPDSAMLRLKDLARIELGGQGLQRQRPRKRPHRGNGRGLSLPGANAIETGKLVLARVKEIAKNPAGRHGIHTCRRYQ